MNRARDGANLSAVRFRAAELPKRFAGMSSGRQSEAKVHAIARLPAAFRSGATEMRPNGPSRVIKCRRHRHGPRTGQIVSDVKQAVSGVKRRAEPPTQTLLRAAAAGIRRCLFRQRNGGARDEADHVADARGNEA